MLVRAVVAAVGAECPPPKKGGGGGIENIDFMFLYHKLFSNHSSPETVRFK
jgi:hypothetical protein